MVIIVSTTTFTELTQCLGTVYICMCIPTKKTKYTICTKL